VRAKLKKRLQEREQGLSTNAGNMTVRQFLEAWIRDVIEPGDLEGKTKQGYELTVRNTSFLVGPREARKADAHARAALYQQRACRGQGPAQGAGVHAVLRIAPGQAVLWGLIPRNVAKFVKGPRYRAAERRPFTRAEQAAILDAAEHERMGVAIFLVHATGTRLSELLGNAGQTWTSTAACCG
jgi:integrase